MTPAAARRLAELHRLLADEYDRLAAIDDPEELAAAAVESEEAEGLEPRPPSDVDRSALRKTMKEGGWRFIR